MNNSLHVGKHDLENYFVVNTRSLAVFETSSHRNGVSSLKIKTSNSNHPVL